MNKQLIIPILFVTLLFSNFSISQKKFIKLENKKTGKTKTINENKKIVITLDYDQTLSGTFTILNDKEIKIGGEIINIASIRKLKKQSKTVSVIGNTFLIGGSGLIIVSGLLYAVNPDNNYDNDGINDNESNIPAIGLASGLVLGGIGAGINIIGRQRSQEKWNYKIVVNE